MKSPMSGGPPKMNVLHRLEKVVGHEVQFVVHMQQPIIVQLGEPSHPRAFGWSVPAIHWFHALV